MNTQTTDQLFGYDVMSSDGNNVGSVDGVWVDEATGRPEFIAIKTGWLFGKNHIMPVEQAQIDQASQTIQVPYGQDQIKDSPSFGTNDDLSPDDEQQIYSYYGLQRSTASSPTGYVGGGPSTTGTPATEGKQDMTLSEEELQVGKRQEEAGRARLRKVVRTEHEEVPVELRREEVNIEHTPARGEQVPDTAFQEREIDVPVMREEPVVGKEAHAREQVRVGKDVQTEQRTVGGDIRREDVEIEEEGNTNL